MSNVRRRWKKEEGSEVSAGINGVVWELLVWGIMFPGWLGLTGSMYEKVRMLLRCSMNFLRGCLKNKERRGEREKVILLIYCFIFTERMEVAALLKMVHSKLLSWLCKSSSKKRLPPSPPKLPILGNLHQLSALSHRCFQTLGEKYGPVMLIHFGNEPVIVIQSADAASEFLKTHNLILSDKPNTKTTRRLLYNQKDLINAPYGEYWRRLKSICILRLLSGKRVQSSDYIREEETASMMEKIKSCSLSCSTVNLSELFDIVTNDVICRSAFGRKYSDAEDGKKFMMLLRELMHLLGTLTIGEFVPLFSWINRVSGFDRKVDKVAKEIDDFLEQVIQEHLGVSLESSEDKSRQNFVSILLEVYKENNSGFSIDRDAIKGIILDMHAGGTDTTSTTLEWAMTELLRHPKILKKLQTELREILKDRLDITSDDLGKMQYLKAVVKETLRFHPAISLVGRVAREDVTIMGYDIKSGTMILTNVWAIGRDPTSWDEPEKFEPNRFLNSSVDYKGLNFEFLPFGTGRRGCPGISFGMASVELVLANLVHKFEWGLPDGTKLEDLDTTEMPGVAVHRKHPLLAVATKCLF